MDFVSDGFSGASFGHRVWVEHRQVMASSEKSLNKLVAQWGNSLRVHWWQLITVAGEQLSCVSCVSLMLKKMMTIDEDDDDDDDDGVVDVDDVPHPQARRYSTHNT